MKLLGPNQDGWSFGRWTDSILQIKYSKGRPVRKEEPHMHPDCHEYYLPVEGELTLEVDGEEVTVSRPYALMVQSGEYHRIIKKEPEGSCTYWIIKGKSPCKKVVKA